jgi:hypothetical protein
MTMMIDPESLLPYLEAVRTTRLARHTLVTAMQALPKPKTLEQKAEFQRAYAEADRLYAEACDKLARNVAFDGESTQEPAKG